MFTSADATTSPSGAAVPVGFTLFDVNAVANDEITEAIILGSVTDRQDNLWPMDSSQPSPTDLKAVYNQSDYSSVSRFFTTSIPFGTDTGILRAIALRLNSSLGCETVPYTDLPSSCYEDPSESSMPLARHAVRTCVLGDFTWTGGQDRRDISENYWFDFRVNDSTKASSTTTANGSPVQADEGPSFRHHCQQNTTIAYFEPPNYWNNHTVRDIIDISATDTHYQTGPNIPLQPPTLNSYTPIQGPLLTSISAIFGNKTSQTLVNPITTIVSNPLTCYQLSPPFTSLLPFLATTLNISTALPSTSPCGDATLSSYLSHWLQAFSNPDTLTAALTIADIYTSRAMLAPSSSASTAANSSYQSTTPNSAKIFASPGLQIQKVQIPFPAMVLISVLMLIQLVGLWGLAVYASCYRVEMGEVDGG